MGSLRILGDVHGKVQQYIEVIKDTEYSIQLGDMGYDYSELSEIDPEKHVFISGNHDNHDVTLETRHCLDSRYQNRSGMYKDVFFVSGGLSIDRQIRNRFYLAGGKKTYFPNEELSYLQFRETILEYERIKPDIVISHEAPRSIVGQFTNGSILRNFGFDPDTFTTNTSEALQVMFEIHQPKLWLTGHYHIDFQKVINGTKFIILDELSYYDI